VHKRLSECVETEGENVGVGVREQEIERVFVCVTKRELDTPRASRHTSRVRQRGRSARAAAPVHSYD